MTFFCSIWTDFNPRSSCEERPCRNELVIRYNRFQSTLLMRGATLKASAIEAVTLHFNPRSSCEERLGYLGRTAIENNFNPRSSCEERLDRA